MTSCKSYLTLVDASQGAATDSCSWGALAETVTAGKVRCLGLSEVALKFRVDAHIREGEVQQAVKRLWWTL